MIKKIVQGALIGALYAALTLVAAPISFGLMQVRISEALCILLFLPLQPFRGFLLAALWPTCLAALHFMM